MILKEQQAKIKYFLEDRIMSEAVKEVITQTFLEESEGSDVNTLAAERIAIKLLNKAFKRLDEFKAVEKEKLSESEIEYL